MHDYATPTAPGGYRVCWLCRKQKCLTAFPRVDGRRDDTCVKCRKGPALGPNERKSLERTRARMAEVRAQDEAWIQEGADLLKAQREEIMGTTAPKPQPTFHGRMDAREKENARARRRYRKRKQEGNARYCVSFSHEQGEELKRLATEEGIPVSRWIADRLGLPEAPPQHFQPKEEAAE